ncbi:hypothetical protein H310_00667 [Aphanomyces invadans]|uniref:SANT domain-containing protein n=1 Tax=Aphanomyces invadans TaxID=157072 RepID=A0A024UVG1_9STRA|nr:hypothetical protein H310_00667 [Aphanomyces invadans]ETW10344.1 hypothetical protein H310_00667 [Aphanomyces invadans]|eukprot:XP_008861755.1 hypothetical protein H310_00667 [Aphanomyces invadans]
MVGGIVMDVSTSWSDDERSKFILGLQQFGSDWNRIARVVDSKSVQEVYEYASLHYKTMMTGKDLRSLESMQSGVSLLSEQLKSPGVKRLGGVTGSALVSLLPKSNTDTGPVELDSGGAVKCCNNEGTVEQSAKKDNSATHELNTTGNTPSFAAISKPVTRTSISTKVVATPPNALPSNRTRFEDKIKDLSDADIKLLLRKRLLEMQERRQASMLKRQQNEVNANQQISAFQTRHGAADLRDGQISSTSTPAQVPLSKKRKQSATSSSSTTDFFAGVNALAMVSCEALQRFNLKYMRRGGATPDSTDLPSDSDGPSDTDLLPRQRLLQTPASHQCSVPWDFSIAPKQDADKLDTAKRAKWSDDEHRQLLTGVEMRTKVPEHPPSKSYAHFPKTEKSNARGDVLEVAGFLSSLAQVTSPTSESARFDTRMSSAPHVDDL